MNKRNLLKSLVAFSAAATFGVAHAQTPVKFQLDWRFEGPSSTSSWP